MKWRFVAIVGVIFAAAAFLLSGCQSSSGYEMKLDAIRVVDKEAEKVNMSVWIYDLSGEQIRHFFTPGFLNPDSTGDSWVSLDDRDFVPLPEEALFDLDLLGLQIKLNPNRLATPPDATFNLLVDVRELIREGGDAVEKVVRSTSSAYELRVLLRKSG